MVLARKNGELLDGDVGAEDGPACKANPLLHLGKQLSLLTPPCKQIEVLPGQWGRYSESPPGGISLRSFRYELQKVLIFKRKLEKGPAATRPSAETKRRKANYQLNLRANCNWRAS